MSVKPWSLQRRFALGLLIGSALLWVAAFLIGGYVVREEIDEVFDAAMSETALQMLSLAERGGLQGNGLPRGLPETLGKTHDSDDDDEDNGYLRLRVTSSAGDILIQSDDMPEGTPPLGFSNQGRYRFHHAVSRSSNYAVVVAEHRGHRTEAAREAAMALVMPMLALMPFAVAGGVMLLRSGFRPVSRLGRQIERRGVGDLAPLDRTGLPSEMVPVAESVDSLMERLRRALEAERGFTANSAHEIRTPIAAALARTQLLATEKLSKPARQKVADIENELHRLSALAEKLMQLARAEGVGLVSEKARDLKPVLDILIGEMSRLPDAVGRIMLDRDVGETLVSRMDVDAFAVLARNLIENALIHGEAGGPVRIRVRDGELSVINRGAVVPADDIAGLRDRFRRGRTDAVGSGLGLAIADAIARGCGASLALYSPARNRPDGFEAVLRLT